MRGFKSNYDSNESTVEMIDFRRYLSNNNLGTAHQIWAKLLAVSLLLTAISLWLIDWAYGIGEFLGDLMEFILITSPILALISTIFLIVNITKNRKITFCSTKEDKNQCLIAISKYGKYGLLKRENKHLKILLSCKYEHILKVGNESFICKINGRYGIYNPQVKKMIVPIKYDSIEISRNNSLLVAHKGNTEDSFDLDGFRHF